MRLLTSRQRARLLLLTAAILCFILFWWTGKLFRIPVHPGFEAGLLQQPAPLAVLLIVAVVFTFCVAVGTLFTSSIRYNAGLFAACAGLAALSFRGGTMRDTLFWGLAHSTDTATFRTLFLETMALTLLVAAAGWLLDRLYAQGSLTDRQIDLGPADAPSFVNHAPTLALQAIITALGIFLLAPSDDKQQVLAAVAIASFAGAATAESFFPSSPRSWAFLVPLLVALIGYAFAYSNPAGASIGHLTGTFAPLARPLPLDYAAVGPAGALLGHWMARRWALERAQAAPHPA